MDFDLRCKILKNIKAQLPVLASGVRAADGDDPCENIIAFRVGTYHCAVLFKSIGDSEKAEELALKLLSDIKMDETRREAHRLPPTTDGFSPNRALVLPHLLALLGALALERAVCNNLDSVSAFKQAAEYFERALDLDPGLVCLCRSFPNA